MKFKFVFLICLFTLTFASIAQKADDRVLFTIAGKPVTVSEFMYIYTKNNGSKADFSKASLDENLNLYKNFKLKVQYARDQKLDTVPSTKLELAGYRKQLADSYLMDREVSERLVKEAWERSKKDMHLSHILKTVAETASPADTLKAYNAIMEIRDKALKGTSFAQLARENSDDKSAKDNGGDLGYFTALFPSGYYNVENAVYNLKPGGITMPVRSTLGYHIFRLDDVRNARGEIEVAHILIRKVKDIQNKVGDPKVRIDSIYQALLKGDNFEDLAEKYSEDKASSIKGGYIGFFGINRYEKAFEDAVFALTKDGEYTKPIETTAGWHIIKRVSVRPIVDFENSRKRLEPRVKKDARFEEARQALLVKIKKESKTIENKEVLQSFISTLNDTYFANDWAPPGQNSDKVLFSMDNGSKYTIADFETYLKSNTRRRMSMKQTDNIASAVLKMYDDVMNTSLMKYEEGKLEAKYPEFKSLMREYEEGTLLFAASEKMVWKKASDDSTGLKKYFDTNLKGKYKWDKRVEVTVLTQKQPNEAEMKKIVDYFKTHTTVQTENNFNTDKKFIYVENKTYEIGKNPIIDKMNWKEGEVSDIQKDEKTKAFYVIKIDKSLPAGDKTLEESRGYAVADYGDYLEKEWVASLQKTYEVKIDKKVFDSLIKK